MRTWFWTLLLTTVAVVLAVALRENTGQVLIMLNTWRIQVSFAFAVLVLVASFVFLYVALRALSWFTSIPMRVRAWHGRRQVRRDHELLEQGWTELLEGRYSNAEKDLTKLIDQTRSANRQVLAGLSAARAAHALGRTYPGGLNSFVTRMNERAQSLGMRDTRYVEPTGLSSRNQSSANDLALLVGAAYKESLLRELSTSPGREVDVGRRTLQYNNTNRLVKSPEWDIGIQKTGYISEAGQCLVMQTKVAGRKLIMVFLDSAGKLSRIADAERMRRWLESASPSRASAVARNNHG